MGKENKKRYLGDGVYADFDGHHIVLTTSDGLSDTNKIYLDSQVTEAFIKYIEGLSS